MVLSYSKIFEVEEIKPRVLNFKYIKNTRYSSTIMNQHHTFYENGTKSSWAGGKYFITQAILQTVVITYVFSSSLCTCWT